MTIGGMNIPDLSNPGTIIGIVFVLVLTGRLWPWWIIKQQLAEKDRQISVAQQAAADWKTAADLSAAQVNDLIRHKDTAQAAMQTIASTVEKAGDPS